MLHFCTGVSNDITKVLNLSRTETFGYRFNIFPDVYLMRGLTLCKFHDHESAGASTRYDRENQEI